MRLQAPAKINLHLRVGPMRSDGFHPLLTWMATVGLFDILQIDRSQRRETVLNCGTPGVPCDASNLVVKAASTLADSVAKGSSAGLIASLSSPTRLNQKDAGGEARETDREPGIREGGAMTDFGLIVTLHKHIPVGAGLGGGSSDGAFTLLALNRLWNLNWPRQKLMDVAKSLGSDVPFFLNAPSAICRGRGEEVEKHDPPAARWVLLFFWPQPLPTSHVYKKFAELRLGKSSNLSPEPPWNVWKTLKSHELLPNLVNDLEQAAFVIDPALGRARMELQQALKRPVRMSGSGSTLFTLYDSREEADAAARQAGRALLPDMMTVELAPTQADSLNGENGAR